MLTVNIIVYMVELYFIEFNFYFLLNIKRIVDKLLGGSIKDTSFSIMRFIFKQKPNTNIYILVSGNN